MKIQIIDGNNFFRRIIESDPRPFQTIWTTAQSINPTKIWVWDGPFGNARRRKLLPQYKMQRATTSETIYQSLELVKQIVHFTPSLQIQMDEYEADDVVAHLANYFADRGDDVKVMSNDYDLAQLCVKSNITTIAKIKPDIPPDRIRLYKAWVGDPSDNIPGVQGFGAKSWLTFKDDPRLLDLTNAAAQNQWDPVLAEEMFSSSRSKRIASYLNGGGWQLLKTCWDIVGFLDIPHERIEASIIPGVNNPAAAKEIMETWLQPA